MSSTAPLPRKLTREDISSSVRAAFSPYGWTAPYLDSSALVPVRNPFASQGTRNAFMRSTLAGSSGAVRAAQSFYLPVPPRPLPSLTPYTPSMSAIGGGQRPDSFGELWTLYALGPGAEGGGASSVAHGGAIAALLDEQASALIRAYAPAGVVEGMVYCNVRYHASISVPGVVLCKAAKSRVEGRKVWVDVAIEDGEGRVVVRADVLFVNDERGGAKL